MSSSATEPKKKLSQVLRLPQNLRLHFLIEGSQKINFIRVLGTTEVQNIVEQIYQQGKEGVIFRGVTSLDLVLVKIDKPITSFQGQYSGYRRGPQEGVILAEPAQQVSAIWDRLPDGCVHVVVEVMQPNAVHSQPHNNQLGQALDSELVQRYRMMFVKLTSFGNWTTGDLDNNGVTYARHRIPSFVGELEQSLAMKRGMPITLSPVIQAFQNLPLHEYYTPDPARHDANANVMTEAELIHLLHLVSIEPAKWWLRKGSSRIFKQSEASWSLLYPFAAPYDPDQPNEKGITVKVGEDPWPIQIIVQNLRGVCRSYKPKNDLTVLVFDLPRLLLEVNSTQSGQAPHDRHRMLLQATSVIKFANTFLDKYKSNKNFILVAIYISIDGEAERHIMYQDKTIDPALENVYHREKIFRLREQVDRIHFLLELNNFMSALGKEIPDEDLSNQFNGLKRSITDHRKTYGLDSLMTSKRRRLGRRDDHGSGQHAGGSGTGGHAMETEQLEMHGYVVIPEIIEDKGGRMEPLIKLPPHMHTVRQSADTTHAEFIAKHVDEQSIEPEILEYLHTIRPSPHIISLFDAIPTETGKWMIYPKMRSLDNFFCMFADNLQLGGTSAQLGCDLMEGLAYLHESGVAHLDVKPGNLVFTDDFHLLLIDFDTAIRVGSEDEMVEGVYGTRGWMAPEIQEQSLYSPIRADRWSCGKVLLCLLKKSGTEDGDLGRFAKQLMGDDPLHRPSLVDWSEQVDLTLYDDADADEVEEGGEKKSEAMALVEKDSGVDDGLELPATKKPRVGVGLDEDDCILTAY